MRKIISVLMENQPGALSRVVGLFSQRGFNIESLTASPIDDTGSLTRLNLTTDVSDDAVREQIEKQLHKLIDVIKVAHISETDHLEKEVLLLKLKVTKSTRLDLKQIIDIFNGKVLDISQSQYVVELTGNSKKIDEFIAVIKEITEVYETARSGVIGMTKGDKAFRV